jgi:hypothetical protein
MDDLWGRIRSSRDYVTVFTALGAALGLVLTRLGATWQAVSTAITAAAIVFAVLAWLRPRLFPTWRLLELCLCAGQRFPVLRSVDDALRCYWWVAWRRRGLGLRSWDVARLRVEAEVLTGGKDRGDAAATERDWGEHLAAMLDERRLMGPTAPGASRFRTEIPDCLPLTSAATVPAVDRYFAALARVRRADDRFLADLHVKSAYVAPLYLLTGQLGLFDDNWRSIVHAYANVVAVDDPIADPALRHLRAFQFACWIVWGPSIPICTCQAWRHEERTAVGFQLGYGDENTSVVLYDETPGLRLALRRARRRVARAMAPDASPQASPVAVELEAVAVVRRPASIDLGRLCQAQVDLVDARQERLVLEFRRLDAPPRAAGRSYYSAYLWVMFALEVGDGQLLAPEGEPWRALMPFFVHGNIAEPSTYAFLKERLAHEALDAIEAVVGRQTAPPRVSFVYVSAIDDTGCGSRLLIEGPGEPIKSTLRRLLATRFGAIASSVRIEDDPARLRGRDGVYYAERFSSCHLPETIGTYFTCLDHLRQGLPHGARGA